MRAWLCACLLLTAACAGEASEHAGVLHVQISGEAAATDGFLFPSGSDVTFADGWALHFSHVLVTVADVTLAENPDKAPADQSQTDADVARARGPWAVDLALAGSEPAVGGEGSATPLTTLTAETLRGGEPFALDQRYAFGYRIAVATDDAARVNFGDDAEAQALYARMIERGYAVLYAGTATFAGEDCESSDASYDFSELPREVPFELGFATPTRYVNCQNQENQGEAFDGEEYQRGLSLFPQRAAVAQLTLHLEHPFFSDTVHDSSVLFDQMAIALRDGAGLLTLEALDALDPTAFADAGGHALPWRACPTPTGAPELPPGKQRGFGVGHTLVDPDGDSSDSFRNYGDYVRYLQSTQGHLNGGEGLCYVIREYPAPG